MRKLGAVTMQFVPYTARADPRSLGGWLSWKAIIDGKQYGSYTALEPKDKELSAEILTPFLAGLHASLLDLLAMTPEQAAEAAAKAMAEYERLT